jgi:hypothetical protein
MIDKMKRQKKLLVSLSLLKSRPPLTLPMNPVAPVMKMALLS